MANVNLTERLRDEYSRLYSSCEIRVDKFSAVDNIVDKILGNRTRYEAVASHSKIPWYFIAAIHNLESSQRFTRHLHNGDPLTARTRQVPKGRPKTGNPPYTWEESATDALKLKRLDKIDDWSLPRLLYELESYNGWGYRRYHPEVLSPYLWGFSNHYTQGKYIADGTWSHTAKSQQCGAVVVIRRLEEREEISKFLRESRRPLYQYSPRKDQDRAQDLQRFMNSFDGISLRVDGKFGPMTSSATHMLFGSYLHGDSRNDTSAE